MKALYSAISFTLALSGQDQSAQRLFVPRLMSHACLSHAREPGRFERAPETLLKGCGALMAVMEHPTRMVFGGDTAFHTARTPVRTGSTTPHPPPIQQPHHLIAVLIDHHRWRISDRPITEHSRTRAPLYPTDRHRGVQQLSARSYRPPTDRLSTSTHVQQVARRKSEDCWGVA